MTDTPQVKPEEPGSSKPADRPTHIAVARFSAVEFLVVLIVFFMTLPFLEKLPNRKVVEAVLMTVVLSSAVLAVGRRPKILLWALVLLVPAITGKWVDHYRPDLISPVVFPVTGLVFVAFIVGQLLRFILESPKVNSEVLCAGISSYLLLGLLWMFAYVVVGVLVPESFAFNSGTGADRTMDGFNAYYFSFVTLSTVGYGDITPVSNPARALAVMESIAGTLYVAVLVARLVALYSSERFRFRNGRPH
jgi:Ion channel